MTEKFNRRVFVAGAAAATSPLALMKPSFAEGHATMHEVQMLNKDPENPRVAQVFVPRIVRAKPGDTIKFVAADRGHNTASVKDMIPEGTEAWNSKINDDFELVVETPGFYGYQCTPHATTGMVGLIIVEGEGMMDNLEDAQGVRQRGRARNVWEEIWEEVEGMEFEMA